jgi:hypothetical protein
MNRLRRLAGRMVGPIGLVLALALVIGGVHHHSDGRAHDACSICSLSHAPAITTDSVAASTPTLRAESVASSRLEVPLVFRIAAAPSRAPPLSS